MADHLSIISGDKKINMKNEEIQTTRVENTKIWSGDVSQ